MTNCTGQGGTGTLYTYAELEGLWINAGGPKAVAPIAAAIAEAESGGCTAAVNPVDNNGTQTSWGLWQISNGTHAMPVPNILNAAVNAQQAVAKYNAAGGFSPWGTYDSGAYKAFVNNGTTPDTNVPGSSSGSSGSSGSGSSSSSSCLLNIPLVGCALSKSEARALIGGGLLVLSSFAGLVGLLVLAAAGFRASGAGRGLEHAGGAIAVVPGLEGAGLAVAAAGRTAPQRRQARARQAGTETTVVEERTPIEGEMGGTRRTRRTVRRPAAAT